MNNQYTLKVYPAGMGHDVYRTIEICGKDTLDQLCRVILDAFDFIDEHLYEFCMDNRMYSEYSYQSDSEAGGPSTAVKLDKINLCKDQKFSLHYDFGDDWMFTIRVMKIIETERYHKLSVVKEKGAVEQYPDYEEWEDEWEDEEDL